MTRTKRTQVGGWAALVAAFAIPLEIAALVITQGPVEERLSSAAFVAGESLRVLGMMVAAIALDPWLRDIDPRLGTAASAFGAVGGGLGLVGEANLVTGGAAGAVDLVLFVVVNGAIGCWLIIAGAILLRAGDEIGRIGWVGQLGGAGLLLGAAVVAFGVLSQGRGSPPFFAYAQLLGVFAIIFLVRVWRYAALGRLPGPGQI